LIVQYNALHFSAAQRSTVRYKTVPYITSQHRTVPSVRRGTETGRFVLPPLIGVPGGKGGKGASDSRAGGKDKGFLCGGGEREERGS
jgi:hypothetical protein